LVHRIADLKAEAASRGYGTLSYFLDIAERESTIQADQEANDLKAKHVQPADLGLPNGCPAASRSAPVALKASMPLRV
jgi:hypothetical protein